MIAADAEDLQDPAAVEDIAINDPIDPGNWVAVNVSHQGVDSIPSWVNGVQAWFVEVIVNGQKTLVQCDTQDEVAPEVANVLRNAGLTQ